jgi:hypothetical protein
VGPPSGTDPETWAQKKREGAEEAWAGAKDALALVKKRLSEGNETKAKAAALTMAILVDKSSMLEQASAQVGDREAKIAAAQGRRIADAILAVLDDLGLPRSDSIRELIAHHLKHPPGDSRRPAPNAADARDALRRQLRGEWERELRRVEPSELPPGEEIVEAEVVEEEEELDSDGGVVGRFKVARRQRQ